MQPTMINLFMEHYQSFAGRLRRRRLPDEFVNDVMQETFLRVEGMGSSDRAVHNPVGYLFRMALNVAADQRKADSRLLTGGEIDELLHIADDCLDPAWVFRSRQEIGQLETALMELTARQRAILLAARVEETPQADIARHFGISTRMVGKELKKALEHCGRRLDRKVTQRFGPGSGKTS